METLLQAGQVSRQHLHCRDSAGAEISACLSGEHPRTPLNIRVANGGAPLVLMGILRVIHIRQFIRRQIIDDATVLSGKDLGVRPAVAERHIGHNSDDGENTRRTCPQRAGGW